MITPLGMTLTKSNIVPVSGFFLDGVGGLSNCTWTAETSPLTYYSFMFRLAVRNRFVLRESC